MADLDDRPSVRSANWRRAHRSFAISSSRCTGDGRPTILISGEVTVRLAGRRLLTVGRDTTYREGAEEALHKHRVEYRELIENANDVVFKIDDEGLLPADEPGRGGDRRVRQMFAGRSWPSVWSRG
jgi:PAS domain-containing protein